MKVGLGAKGVTPFISIPIDLGVELACGRPTSGPIRHSNGQPQDRPLVDPILNRCGIPTGQLPITRSELLHEDRQEFRWRSCHQLREGRHVMVMWKHLEQQIELRDVGKRRQRDPLRWVGVERGGPTNRLPGTSRPGSSVRDRGHYLVPGMPSRRVLQAHVVLDSAARTVTSAPVGDAALPNVICRPTWSHEILLQGRAHDLGVVSRPGCW